VRLVVEEASGRVTTLPAPRSGALLRDADFSVKVLAVRWYWHARRLPVSPWSSDGSWPDDLALAAFLGRQQSWQQNAYAAAICLALVIVACLFLVFTFGVLIWAG
jgi:ABC-type glycerol-3-phosphate transport system permease component